MCPTHSLGWCLDLDPVRGSKEAPLGHPWDHPTSDTHPTHKTADLLRHPSSGRNRSTANGLNLVRGDKTRGKDTDTLKGLHPDRRATTGSRGPVGSLHTSRSSVGRRLTPPRDRTEYTEITSGEQNQVLKLVHGTKGVTFPSSPQRNRRP